MTTSRQNRIIGLKPTDPQMTQIIVQRYGEAVVDASLPVIMTATAVWAASVVMGMHKSPKARMVNYRQFLQAMKAQMQAHSEGEGTEDVFHYDTFSSPDLIKLGQAEERAAHQPKIIMPIDGTDPTDMTTIIGTDDLDKIEGFEKLDLSKPDKLDS